MNIIKMLKCIRITNALFVFSTIAFIGFNCGCINNQNKEIVIEYQELSNGEVKPLGARINGHKEGLWLTYGENGYTIREVCFVNNIENGPFKYYFEWNGKIQTKGYLKDGYENGYLEQYNSNGMIYRKGKMIKGVPDSIWEYFTSNGFLNKKMVYRNGEAKTILDNHLEIPPPPK